MMWWGIIRSLSRSWLCISNSKHGLFALLLLVVRLCWHKRGSGPFLCWVSSQLGWICHLIMFVKAICVENHGISSFLEAYCHFYCWNTTSTLYAQLALTINLAFWSTLSMGNELYPPILLTRFPLKWHLYIYNTCRKFLQTGREGTWISLQFEWGWITCKGKGIF